MLYILFSLFSVSRTPTGQILDFLTGLDFLTVGFLLSILFFLFFFWDVFLPFSLTFLIKCWMRRHSSFNPHGCFLDFWLFPFLLFKIMAQYAYHEDQFYYFWMGNSRMWCSSSALYNYHHYTFPTLSSLLTEIPQLLNNNSPFLHLPIPGNHYSTFCLYKFKYSRHFASMESHSISFWVWLIAPKIIFSEFIWIVTWVIHCFSRLQNISLNALSHFICLFIHLQTFGLFLPFGLLWIIFLLMLENKYCSTHCLWYISRSWTTRSCIYSA